MPDKKTATSIGELKVTTFEVPPGDFDPLTAPSAKLAQYGLAPKPDQSKEPELYKKWQKLYAKKLAYIVPEFRRNEQKYHRPATNRVDIKAGSSTSTNWSGGIVTAPAGDSFKTVTGNWIVPDPNQPPGQPTGQAYYSAAWIGIDGWGSNDVLQAGTDSDILVQNGVAHKTVEAWWEWFPEASVTINNLPVTSGDYMTCLITATSATTATVILANISTNTHASFKITIPAGATFKGNCAEWIQEAPTVNNGQSALCDYGATFFDEASATTQKGVVIKGGSGNTINMTNSTGTVISQALIETPELVKVSFV